MKLVPKVFLVTHSETDDKGPVRVLLVRRRKNPKAAAKGKKKFTFPLLFTIHQDQ